jgi:GNAT superfamily N-acetyltransferase
VDIEEVDARSAPDDMLARFHAVEAACHGELHPGEPGRGVDEVVAFHRHRPSTTTSCYWLADGGTAVLSVHGPRAAFLELLVEPGRRRAGLGTALLEHVLARCRELEVDVLRGAHSSAAGAAFAARCGAVDEQRIVRSLLDLCSAELHEPRLPDGFGLVTWFGRVPDEHLAAFVRVREAMDDAPAPEGLDFPTWTGERVRAMEESLAQRDREMRVTVAMAADGRIGAFTELRVSPGSALGFTDDTGTVAAERGKGLARAVKLESLRRLAADHPEVEVVCTSNAEENVVMRRLNESIGFRASLVETLAGLELGSSNSVGRHPR